MIARVRFHSIAERELDEAIQYYAEIGPELAEASIDEIGRGIRSIRQYPKAAPAIAGPLRRYIIRRFPYGIVYASDSNEVFIVAVAHLKRRPLYWAGRT